MPQANDPNQHLTHLTRRLQTLAAKVNRLEAETAADLLQEIQAIQTEIEAWPIGREELDPAGWPVDVALENTSAAVEAERRRLAALLESTLIAQLRLLLAQAQAFERNLPPHLAALSQMLTALARQVLAQAQTLIDQLQPALLATTGLAQALELLANQAGQIYGLHCTVSMTLLPDWLPNPIELTLFRAAQEAIEVAIHQAHASQMNIRLSYEDERLTLWLGHNGLTHAANPLPQLTHRRLESLGGTVQTKRVRPGEVELTITFTLTAPPQLTPRELEVLQWLAAGLSNKAIARRLSLSPRTVNFHLDNIYSKLGVNSRTEAVLAALRYGWFQRPFS